MKKITTLMMTMALMLLSTTSWAPKPEVMQVSPSVEIPKLKCESPSIHFFSKNPADYMLTIHQNRGNDKHFIVYYGKLMPDHDFSDLMEIFNDYGDDYHPNIDKAIDQDEDIADQKMQPFFWNISWVDRTAMPSNCEAIKEGTAFRCTTKWRDHTKGKPLELVIQGYKNTWVSFRAADPCFFPKDPMKFPDMHLRATMDDKDGDGTPDSYKTLTLTISKIPSIKEPSEEAPPEELTEAPDELTPPTDIGEPSEPLSTGDQAATLPTGESEADIQAAFDKAGGCNLINTASANPASFLMSVALLALVRRRRK